MNMALSFFHNNTQRLSRDVKRRSVLLWPVLHKKVVPKATRAESHAPTLCDDQRTLTADDMPMIKDKLDLDDDQLVEDNDILPPYTCTVYKMGYLKLKKELDKGGRRARDRSWRMIYLSLQGTALHCYTNKSSARPFMQISMQHAEAGLAPDYKCEHAFRLRLPSGEQFLMRPDNLHGSISWIEHLQASANISLDIDLRPMPRILTMPRHQTTTHVTSVAIGSNSRAVIPVVSSQRQRRRAVREALI